MVSEKVTEEKNSIVVEIPDGMKWKDVERLVQRAFFRRWLKSRVWLRGDTEVAEAIGVAPPTVSSWFRVLDMTRPYKQRR